METFYFQNFVENTPLTPPPSPEGELMETIALPSKRKAVESFPPPSPEGELMETFFAIIVAIAKKGPPPSPEGELMETGTLLPFEFLFEVYNEKKMLKSKIFNGVKESLQYLQSLGKIAILTTRSPQKRATVFVL